MRPADVFRTLAPSGWLAIGALVLVAVAILARGVGLSWDPLGLGERRLRAAEARAAATADNAAARTEEVAGERLQRERIEIHHHTTRAVDALTAAAATDARSADDADFPLDSSRTDRLRAHDRELCRLAPALDGCAAPIEPG